MGFERNVFPFYFVAFVSVFAAQMIWAQAPATDAVSRKLEAKSDLNLGRLDATEEPVTVEKLLERIEKLERSNADRLGSQLKSEPIASDQAPGTIANNAESVKNNRSDDKWTVKLGGHVQMDYVNWTTAAPSIVGQQDYFEFRRLRLVADGSGYGDCDFRLQVTLEPESIGDSPPGTATSPDVKDAYFSLNHVPGIGRLRFGNFFVPFSLEQVTNDTNNIFLERSIPTQGVFAVDREVGIANYNASTDRRVTWSSGIFFDGISDTLKERIDDNQGLRLAGRVTWLPYYDEPSNGRYLLHTGLGVLHTNDHDDRVRFRARPQTREGPRLIDSDVINAHSYTTGNIEAAAVMGRVALQSEAFLSNVNVLLGDSVTVNGVYLHASYFVTGENRIFERYGQHGAQFGRNVPINNFKPTAGQTCWGAIEAKARWSHLDLSNLSSGQYNDFTFGFNWYWSDRTRWMFDWIHPLTTRDTPFGITESNLLALRFDVNW
ncbi:MAG: porin [Pirellulaceae bacterium]